MSPTTITTTLTQTTTGPTSVTTVVITTQLVSNHTETKTVVSTITTTVTTTSLITTASASTVAYPVNFGVQAETTTTTTESTPTTTTTTTTTSTTTITSTTTSTTITNNPTTRTSDWWARHVDFLVTTWDAFVASTDGGVTICGVHVSNAPQLMGAFWASRNQTSTGAERGMLGAREMALVQNYLAGLLNVQAFGANDGHLMQAAWKACQTGDPTVIAPASLALAAWDMSNNKVPTSLNVGVRDSASGLAFADIPYWDTI